MTAITASEARDLTDRLRSALAESADLLARAPRRDRRCARASFIYFIQTGQYADDPVKIGVAQDIKVRIATFQTGSPYPVRLLGSLRGGEADERKLHARFSHLHIRGEWFEGAPELLSFVAELPR